MGLEQGGFNPAEEKEGSESFDAKIARLERENAEAIEANHQPGGGSEEPSEGGFMGIEPGGEADPAMQAYTARMQEKALQQGGFREHALPNEDDEDLPEAA